MPRSCAVGAPLRRAGASAVSSTQAPIGTIRPFSSASGMNSAGEITPHSLVGPAQQRLARDHRAVGERDDRLVVDLELVGATARCAGRARRSGAGRPRARRSASKIAKRSRPAGLRAVHRDVGLVDHAIGASRESCAVARPTLAVTATGPLPSSNGSANACEHAPRDRRPPRGRTRAARAGSRTRRRRGARRCRRRGPRRAAAAAASTSSRSPASWPMLSLIWRNASRSTNRTPRCRLRALRGVRARASARRRRPRDWAATVSGSRPTRCSSRIHSVTSLAAGVPVTRRGRCRSTAASASCRRCGGGVRAARRSPAASRACRRPCAPPRTGRAGAGRRAASGRAARSAGQPRTRSQAALTATKRAWPSRIASSAAGVVEELLEGLRVERRSASPASAGGAVGSVGDQPERHDQGGERCCATCSIRIAPGLHRQIGHET